MRGRYVLQMAARTNHHVLNVGNVSTFRHPVCGETIPDVSFASEGIINRFTGLQVLEDSSASDYQAIVFEVHPVPSRESTPLRQTLLLCNNHQDSEIFHGCFHETSIARFEGNSAQQHRGNGNNLGAEDLSTRTMVQPWVL